MSMKRLAAMGRWWRWTAIVLMLVCASRADSVVDPLLQELLEHRLAARTGPSTNRALKLPSLNDAARPSATGSTGHVHQKTT